MPLPIPRSLQLISLPDALAIVRLEADDAIPTWATLGALTSITRSTNELSLVVEEQFVPATAQAERGWHAFRVAGTFDLTTEIGVIAALAQPLAEAGISLFVISTFDTDYVLIKQERREDVAETLRNAGHEVDGVKAPRVP